MKLFFFLEFWSEWKLYRALIKGRFSVKKYEARKIENWIEKRSLRQKALVYWLSGKQVVWVRSQVIIASRYRSILSASLRVYQAILRQIRLVPMDESHPFFTRHAIKSNNRESSCDITSFSACFLALSAPLYKCYSNLKWMWVTTARTSNF